MKSQTAKMGVFLSSVIVALMASAWAWGGGSSSVGGDVPGLQNPASIHCLDVGGKLEILYGKDGQTGFCFLGRAAIEQWTLYRAQIQGPSQASNAFLRQTAPQGEFSCQGFGGVVEVWRSPDARRSVRACRFHDRSMIEVDTLKAGFEAPGYETLASRLMVSVPRPISAPFHALHCVQNPNYVDAGFVLDLEEVMVAPPPRDGKARFVATLEEQNFAGAKLLGRFKVLLQDQPPIPGAPMVFSGKGLELTLQVDEVPRSDRGIAAQLLASVEERMIHTDMTCFELD